MVFDKTDVKIKQQNLCVYFSETVSVTRKLLSEFEQIPYQKHIKKIFPTVEGVYMYTIIMHLGKIFTQSTNESYRLKAFKTLFPNTSTQIEDIFNNRSEIIDKINVNRDKLLAHTDPKFYELGFSELFIREKEKALGTKLPQLKATSKQEERYSPSDLRVDSKEIKELLTTCDKMWKEALLTIH